MSIREISCNKFPQEKELHRVWELRISDNLLLLKRYGNMCFWTKMKIEKDGTEVYRLTTTQRFSKNGRDIGERNEFFFNNHARKYRGNQFCFIEYIDIFAEQERFPEPEEYIRMGMDADTEKEYRKYIQKILND